LVLYLKIKKLAIDEYFITQFMIIYLRLDVNQEAIATTSFASIGFVFSRIEPIQED
jgi:hypothetical protein